MARTLFFRMLYGLRNFSEITSDKPIFSLYNIFYKYKYFLFQFAFWSLFNHRQKVNQIRNNVVCVVARLVFVFCCALTTGLCFSAYFRKLKEIGVLRPIFLRYFISCDYNITGWYLTSDYQYLVKTINILMLKRQNANPKHF